jgi:hypothetical protein
VSYPLRLRSSPLWTLHDLLGALQVRYLNVPIVFCDATLSLGNGPFASWA